MLSICKGGAGLHCDYLIGCNIIILHHHHQVTGHDQAVLESYVKFVTTAARALDIEMARW